MMFALGSAVVGYLAAAGVAFSFSTWWTSPATPSSSSIRGGPPWPALGAVAYLISEVMEPPESCRGGHCGGRGRR